MTHSKVKTGWKIGYLYKEQLWKIKERKGKAADSHHFSCASRAEWIDVMVTGSPRTLSMPEVTDTQSALIQAQKPTKAMLSSKEVQGGANPAHHS